MSAQIITRGVVAAAITVGWAGAAFAGISIAHADGVKIDAQGEVRGSATQYDRKEGPAMSAYPARQGSDPVVSIGADGTVRPADMADVHRPSVMAEPQAQHEANAVQHCYRGETTGGIFNIGSERCQDAGR